MTTRRAFFAATLGGVLGALGPKVAQVHQVPGLGEVRFWPSALPHLTRKTELDGLQRLMRLVDDGTYLEHVHAVQRTAYPRLDPHPSPLPSSPQVGSPPS